MIVIDMDMPESCNECPLFDNEYLHCQKTKEQCETWEFKPTKSCPIKCEIEQIRAEIEQHKNDKFNCIGINDVLKIIDKYAEQSGWEEMTVPCENCGHDMTFKIATIGEPCEDCKYKSMAEQEPTTRPSCENCKILELLVDMEIPTICEDDYNDCEYCEQNCNFKAPTKECYLHWAEHKRKAVSE